MEEAGGSGMGGMPGAVPNPLDAGAQAFYPAVCAPYPFQPLPHQLYCPQPFRVMPPPPPVMAQQQLGYSVPAAATVVDGPASRAVVLSLVPPQAPEAEVARAMAPFGAVRAVDASALASEGVATVHFFDLRAADLAVTGVRQQHMLQQSRLGQLYAAATASPTWPLPPPPSWDWPHDDSRGLVLGQAVWAHFAAASTLPDDGANRGSLIVLNSLPGVSLSELREAFQAFGDVKDVRESAQRPSHKFVEFFDTRDAARALAELNGKDLFGRRLVIEFTRPSGPGTRRRAYVSHQPMAPIPPRLQAAWLPAHSPSQPPQAAAAASSSCGTGKAREGVVLLRRTSAKAGAGGNPGTSHERKGKGGKNNVASASSSSAASASSSTATASSKQGPKGSGRGGNWRGQKSGWEARFLFKEPAADDAAADTVEPASWKDTRTTVMIRNIPNKYSQKLLLNMLDNHCILSNEQIAASDDGEGEGAQPFSSYDFAYLPIDFNNKCNVGYGFVNLTSPEATVRLYKAFHKQPWEVFNSRKICQVTYARVQGLDALKEHFKNSKFPCDSDEYLPVVFSPPRDGKQLTEPVPMVGRSPAPPSPPKSRAASVDQPGQELIAPPSSSGDGASSTTTSDHAPSDPADEEHASSDDDDDDGGLGEELQGLGYTN